MIISLRGTSGSGKSTLVRRITSLYEGGGLPFHVDGRRRAYYTTWTRSHGGAPLTVPGHYDIANGGVDTLGTLDEAYALARRFAAVGHDVLMEGKCMSDGVPHALALYREKFDVRIVHIDTPILDCVRSVRNRGHNIKEASIMRTHYKIQRSVTTFRTLGLPHVVQVSREGATALLREWLNV